MQSGPSPTGEVPPAGPERLPAGGESVALTMQAEAAHMTIDEALASGLFDMADEPGMVRIPISMNVMIPMHLLLPPSQPGPPSDHDLPQHPDGAPLRPPARPPGHRFGSYPRGVAAYNVMAALTS